MVVAPHPDDEVLGCGGFLLRAKENDVPLTWVIGTEMSEEAGFASERIDLRDSEIDQIKEAFGFENVLRMGFPTTQVDRLAQAELIGACADILQEQRPEILLLPSLKDAHSDHRLLSEAFLAASKVFRAPFIRQILAYETISETDALPRMNESLFNPNVYLDISDYLEKKVQLMRIYESEGGEFPFPRSGEAITALAKYRGSQSGLLAAEAYELVLERLGL